MRFSVQGDYVFDRKDETAVARRNERNFSSALFFLQSFFFCALCVKRKSVIGGE